MGFGPGLTLLIKKIKYVVFSFNQLTIPAAVLSPS